MKHCLILSLCAVALAAFSINTANATVDVALNLNYIDPADPSEGGSWTLVAKSDAADGIAGLVARFNDGTIPAAGTVAGNVAHGINGGALQIGTFTDPNAQDFVEFVYGQDPNVGTIGNVGLAGAAANQGVDPLNNSVWDDASVIATGSFLSTRPVALLAAATEFDPNGAIVGATIGDFNVRGDSLRTIGLEDPNGAGLQAGDANRNGSVTIADFGILQPNFGQPGVFGWDDGDFNDTDSVTIADFGLLQPNFGFSGTPPAIGAVPEPSSVALLLAGMFGLGFRKRKS